MLIKPEKATIAYGLWNFTMSPKKNRIKKTELPSESLESEGAGLTLPPCASGANRAEVMNTSSAVTPEDILKAINDTKVEFSIKFENVLSAVDNVKKEVKDCAERISHAEVRI